MKCSFCIVSNKWSVFGTSQIQLKTNHTTRIVIGLLALFVVTSFVLNGRVQMLIDRNGALEEQIGMLEERMKFVMEQMTRLSQKTTNGAILNSDKNRVKRATKEIRQFEAPSLSVPLDVDELENVRSGNESHGLGRALRALKNDPQEPKQQLGVSSPKKGKYLSRQKNPGKCSNNNLAKLREKHKAKLARLNLRLQIAKQRASSAILQLKAHLSSIRYGIALFFFSLCFVTILECSSKIFETKKSFYFML